MGGVRGRGRKGEGERKASRNKNMIARRRWWRKGNEIERNGSGEKRAENRRFLEGGSRRGMQKPDQRGFARVGQVGPLAPPVPSTEYTDMYKAHSRLYHLWRYK